MLRAKGKPRPAPTPKATGALVLADGTVFTGEGFGREGKAAGEVCFNTSITGYQEILTDPSYAGQIITFTFPHIGNVGANAEDMETQTPAARGFILREEPSPPSSYRSERTLADWARSMGLVGLAGIDTRRLTRHIRIGGALNGVIAYHPKGAFDIPALLAEAKTWPSLEGMDLAKEVTTRQTYTFNETRWQWGKGYGKQAKPRFKVVAVDYGIKRNILRCLASSGAAVTVVSCTASAEDILAHKPDGIFLSNGPGDPAATGVYAIPELKKLLESGKPMFGICLGHQLLALALGAKTEKMHQGHRGANHPVKDLKTGRVEITTMNHGFTVSGKDLPAAITVTHRSLFDGTVCGFEVKGKPVFCIQNHPEASPGPQDAHHLFEKFVKLIEGKP
ncbi:MAG TPA: glutamine-hydrolyzing carbamoyl-phosphate synthase small subunit [Sphingomonadales bacterium]|nr:glutamine-hydrolyzing carbamoyl-phosphate synthase small subunit [Sphingomonadales bacterium]